MSRVRANNAKFGFLAFFKARQSIMTVDFFDRRNKITLSVLLNRRCLLCHRVTSTNKQEKLVGPRKKSLFSKKNLKSPGKICRPLEKEKNLLLKTLLPECRVPLARETPSKDGANSLNQSSRERLFFFQGNVPGNVATGTTRQKLPFYASTHITKIIFA
jgi:predicted membrane metal-binding protein